MELLAVLENALFALGQILRLPVMVLLWCCVIAVLTLTGSCIMEVLQRRRQRSGFSITGWLQQGSVLTAESKRISALPLELHSFITALQQAHSDKRLDDGGLEHTVLLSEENARNRLNLAKLMVKAGPSLGLIGTLIPMGSSMAAMASGDLEAMAGQMVVAFTTTIVGIACGTVAFVIATVRQQWLNETVREQRYLAEHVLHELAGAN